MFAKLFLDTGVPHIAMKRSQILSTVGHTEYGTHSALYDHASRLCLTSRQAFTLGSLEDSESPTTNQCTLFELSGEDGRLDFTTVRNLVTISQNDKGSAGSPSAGTDPSKMATACS